jgi:hypothetical protein
MEDVEVGKVVQTLLGTYPRTRPVDVKFQNLDINYLQRKTGLEHQFVARMLRIFGEAVVLESLRRFANGYQYAPGREEAVFVGIARAVEHVAIQTAGGEPHGDAAGLTVGTAPPPASQPEKV